MLGRVYWHSLLPGGGPVHFGSSAATSSAAAASAALAAEWVADAVVIGGGLTGLSCAYHLCKLGKSVVVLEERGLCDGATGRNGGHCWPSAELDSPYGRIEAQDYASLTTFIDALPEAARAKIAFKNTGGVVLRFDGLADVPLPSHVKYPAGTVAAESNGSASQFVPGRLVLALAEQVLSMGGKILTGVRAAAVTPVSTDHHRWAVSLEPAKAGVDCPTELVCGSVVHAWNGYGAAESFLPPRLSSVLTSVRGQVVSLKGWDATRPPLGGSGVCYDSCSESHEEYMLTRSSKVGSGAGDDHIVIGGMRHLQTGEGRGERDDSVVEAGVAERLAGEVSRLFPGSCETVERTHAWSGILCFSKDRHPMVGEVAETPGQFVSVGYTGHGMPRAFSCGRHVAELIACVPPSCPEIDRVFSPDRFD